MFISYSSYLNNAIDKFKNNPFLVIDIRYSFTSPFIIFFYSSYMSLVYKSIQERHQQASADECLDENTLSITSIGRFLRKVGLKIPDVKMKLGINKIIHYLQKLSTQHYQQSSLINQLHENNNTNCQITQFDRQECEKQNEAAYCQPNNFARIDLSKSLSESRAYQDHFDIKKTDLLIKQSTLSKAFNVKQVVTRNALDQAEANYHARVRFTSSVPSVSESDTNFQIIEQLQLENQNLEKCLKNIFTFFENKKLFCCEGLTKQHYSSGVDQLTYNFINYEREIEQKMTNLQAKSSHLQQTVHNMSISFRLQKQNLQQDRINNSKLIQTDQQIDQQVESLKKELSETSSTLRQKEVILFIKEEEINSLKVIISDLENKLKMLTVGQVKVRQKNYKKFFEITGQNLSKTE